MYIMQTSPDLLILAVACFADAFSGSIVLLLCAAVLFALIAHRWPLFIRLLLPILLISLYALTFPIPVFPWEAKGFLLIWIPLTGLLSYCAWRSLGSHRLGDRENSPIFAWAAHGMVLMVFAGLLLHLVQTKSFGVEPNWLFLNSASLIIAVFFLLYEIIPPWILSIHRSIPIFRLFFYLAIGLFVLRGGMWGYGLFHGALKEGAGSFRLKGVVYSEQLAKVWRFPRLDSLLKTYWYYPIPPGAHKNETLPMNDPSLLNSGMQQAEAFRRSLFQPASDGPTHAALLARAIPAFQEAAEKKLSGHETLRRFSLNEEDLLQQIKGENRALDGKDIFLGLYGRWNGSRHPIPDVQDWYPLETYVKPCSLPGEFPLSLQMKQYGWLGDGFGWNGIVRIQNPDSFDVFMEVILRIVYRVKDQNPHEIEQATPLLGVAYGLNQIIWISAGEVFFEEIVSNFQKLPETYSRTGFRYSIENNKLIVKNPAFQTLYARNAKPRQPIYEFTLDLSVDSL